MGELDAISATLEREQLRAAVLRLGETTERREKAACKVSADNIQREAVARLRRQLLHPTGATEAGLIVRDDYGQVGYVVMSIRRDDREMYNLPLWIEKGTHRGKPGSHTQAPRPYFYPAVKLEIEPHIRRVEEAMAESLAEEGLGD